MKNNIWIDKISDILIVVVGILIALGLDSWYEERKEAALEQQYLSTFLEDISADIKNLGVDREFANEQHESLLVLLRLIRERDTSKLDSILTYTQHLGSFRKFNPHNTVYRSLIQSGDFNIIKDYSLKESLGRLHLDEYETVAIVEEVYIDFYMDLLGFQMKHLNFLTGVVSMKEDFYGLEFSNMIFGLQSATRQKMHKYESAIERATEVKEQLQQVKNSGDQ